MQDTYRYDASAGQWTRRASIPKGGYGQLACVMPGSDNGIVLVGLGDGSWDSLYKYKKTHQSFLTLIMLML